MTPMLAGWENFLVIEGSAAAGLTGLTFIVITLSGQAGRTNPVGLRTFITPTIVHFSTVLGLAALLSMPHLTALALAIGLAAVGIGGLALVGVVAASIHHLSGTYVPVKEDWIWNSVVPGIAYGGILAAAGLIVADSSIAIYSVALAMLLLTFAGIHNAWDIAVWHTVRANRADETGDDPAAGSDISRQ